MCVQDSPAVNSSNFPSKSGTVVVHPITFSEDMSIVTYIVNFMVKISRLSMPTAH